MFEEIRTLLADNHDAVAAERMDLLRRADSAEVLFSGCDLQRFGRYLLSGLPDAKSRVDSAFRTWIAGPENSP